LLNADICEHAAGIIRDRHNHSKSTESVLPRIDPPPSYELYTTNSTAGLLVWAHHTTLAWRITQLTM